jgi:flagellar protein FlbD
MAGRSGGITGKSARGVRVSADEALEAGHPMIELTRLNGNKFSINSDTIKYIEATPDTTISLTTGEKILVAETCETVVNRSIEHRAKVLRLAWPDAGRFLSGKTAESAGGDAVRTALASSSNS